jgi:hypothetical protein
MVKPERKAFLAIRGSLIFGLDEGSLRAAGSGSEDWVDWFEPPTYVIE